MPLIPGLPNLNNPFPRLYSFQEPRPRTVEGL
jgi:hypothetical protein